MKNFTIALCADYQYAPQVLTTIKSVCKNSRGGGGYKILPL